jgi:5-methylcytosine-specific restriction endonuclease McrBC GTP-binding regulatory subunit McrB
MVVNEFTWFVSKNKDLIEEEVLKMSKKIEKAKKTPKTGTCTIKDAVKDDALMQRLMAALRTKPFAILAGHSGTGKSRLVRRLAYMTCNDEGLLEEAKTQNAPGNYLMVQVKPNWHDSSDLLGYYSELKGEYKTTAFVDFICKAYAYPETPFFVCLDEMNLAPVEHYFAEYLSAIESVKEKDNAYSCDPLIADKKIDFRQLLLGDGYTQSQEIYEKQGLIIPKNLFVVGTVNVDETTHQFSRKVLDRAMTLLMNEVKFDTMKDSPKDPSEEDLLNQGGIEFFLNREFKEKLVEDEPERLNKLNEALENTPFIVAYRFANEMALYRKAIAKLADKADALDHVVLMKLLPRIHGEANFVRELFGKLKPLFEGGVSVTEMDKIVDRKDSYLSFWP